MNNPFHVMEQMLQNESIESTEAIRALLATVYLECCDDCGARLRTEDFVEMVRRMMAELKLCRQLTRANAA